LIDSSAYTLICCPVGTGSKLAGVDSSLLPHQHAIGFCA
jgi:hypothetical protein